ncbi:MAG: hypothetical protein HON90_01050 [Halobacteriovoraceae bacterium]|nr:hypothetical protein [Halobacteriovoraceae bacterium]
MKEIIWINGAFGAGKTTLAQELQKRIPHSLIFDPERFGFMLQSMLPHTDFDDFQDIPLWRKLVARNIFEFYKEYDVQIIVPMTLVNKDYRDEIFNQLKELGLVIKHFYLDIDKSILEKRITNQVMFSENKNKDQVCRDWRLAQIDRCLNSKLNLDDDTTLLNSGKLTVEKLADSVLSNLQSKSCKVMLFSTFHFENISKDLVKNSVKNVMLAESQCYLEKLSERISEYSPTTVFLEYDPSDDEKFNNLYQKYLKGEYQLSNNEVDQLGFRIAKLAKLNRVDSFDERNTPWQAKQLFDELEIEDPNLYKEFNKKIQTYQESEGEAHATLSLQELFKKYNGLEMDRHNKSLYLMTNKIGAGNSFAGADATTSWWHRNFRMFAKIQKISKPGARILVIGGQGHIAILKDLVEFDPKLESESILSYL